MDLGPLQLGRISGLRRIARLSLGERGTGNAIIHGENSAVLTVAGPSLTGKVRCVYIDPPYNNGESYTHYNDATDHALWLRQVKARVKQLASILRPDGSLWISIDDREVHYLKVALDDAFGRENFVTTIVWQHRTTRENRKAFSNNHEYVLVYAKDLRAFAAARNHVGLSQDVLLRYKNPDNDPRGPWQSVSANVQAGHATPNQFYELVAPSGRRHNPPNGRCWVYSEERMRDAIARNEIWFGKDGNGVPRIKRFLTQGCAGLTPETLWTADVAGTTLAAKKHILQLLPDYAVFDTPKPETLIQRILTIATDPGDLVLDAYLGSGTTAAVAHKMNRHYIGIEQGEHVVTHCVQRLSQVIAGEAGGISKDVEWSGGGGFDFFRLEQEKQYGFAGYELLSDPAVQYRDGSRPFAQA